MAAHGLGSLATDSLDWEDERLEQHLFSCEVSKNSGVLALASFVPAAPQKSARLRDARTSWRAAQLHLSIFFLPFSKPLLVSRHRDLRCFSLPAAATAFLVKEFVGRCVCAEEEENEQLQGSRSQMPRSLGYDMPLDYGHPSQRRLVQRCIIDAQVQTRRKHKKSIWNIRFFG